MTGDNCCVIEFNIARKKKERKKRKTIKLSREEYTSYQRQVVHLYLLPSDVSVNVITPWTHAILNKMLWCLDRSVTKRVSETLLHNVNTVSLFPPLFVFIDVCNPSPSITVFLTVPVGDSVFMSLKEEGADQKVNSKAQTYSMLLL